MYFLPYSDLRLAGQSGIKYKLFGTCRIYLWKRQEQLGEEILLPQQPLQNVPLPSLGLATERRICRMRKQPQQPPNHISWVPCPSHVLTADSPESSHGAVTALPHTQTPQHGTFLSRKDKEGMLLLLLLHRVHQAGTSVCSMHRRSGVTSCVALPLHRKKQW